MTELTKFIQTLLKLSSHKIGESARQLGQENDLYASVMIAQAILESGSGQSGLSSYPHYNLFGIKGSYAGQSAVMQTWEDDGAGNAYTINDAFRSYPSYYESLQDYVAVLKQGHFAGAWKSNTSSYQDATAALTGVYATDTSYYAKLNNIIETYNLTQYDSPNVQGGITGSVYNPYRQQFTSQEILNLDIALGKPFELLKLKQADACFLYVLARSDIRYKTYMKKS